MLSINATLKLLISLFAIALVAITAYGAFQAWERLSVSDQVAKVEDASASIFKVMHNMRWDRSNTTRLMSTDPAPADLVKVNAPHRTDELDGLAASVDRLQLIDFPGRDEVVAKLQASTSDLKALQRQTEVEWQKPKGERNQTLATDYTRVETAVLDDLSQILAKLDRGHKLYDPYVDQMTSLFHLAWSTRYALGEGSLPVSNALIGMSVSADGWQRSAKMAAQGEAFWATLKEQAATLDLPEKLTKAIDGATKLCCEPASTEVLKQAVAALSAGKPSPIDAAAWAASRNAIYDSLVNVAIDAIDAARDEANAAHATARIWLIAAIAGLVPHGRNRRYGESR